MSKLKHVVPLALLLVVGCGMAAEHSRDKSDAPQAAAVDESESMNTALAGAAKLPDEKPQDATATRKIIYTAHVDLAVEQFDGVLTKVKEMVAQHGGYIANHSRSAETGSNRYGSWTVRIPVDNFDVFMEGATSLGDVIEYRIDSREVTAEYVDIQGWIKNKQLERDRLQELLNNTERVAKLKDVLDTERELARVQGEIESYQGRIRQFDNLVALTTIHLNIRQIHDYVPPEAASFGTLARRSFDASWLAMQRTGQAVALFGVALAPWLPLIIVAIVVLRLGWKRLRTRSRSAVS